ncbi:shieldin complex subunit 2 isoform X1 [Epinephelus moara]|uniref:shieldin complex subunit 2 isoform X1 n=1 Tax=Epinephelus moara TaxID=300413 RepID=UPI00214E2071|nr:shieldin complex subunit 2 isoform X1 [Epinephelus moara]XP_049927244.1 shieldin complex subunit 2 isoform X1 [Epinephelus moara]
MCDRPKIHVFLGAPPPSSTPASVSEAGAESDQHPPADWRHLELTWREGRLRPATDEAGNRLVEERVSHEDVEADQSKPSLQSQDDEPNADQDVSSSKADWTTKASRGQEERALVANTDQEDLRSDDHRPAEIGDEETNPEQEVQCSSSVLEYLDSCFPAAQSEPQKPEPEPPHQSSPADPPLSAQTHYLATWTLSQALILRGRCGVQSATSPEKSPPPRTPPKHTKSPPSVSSSTPELFSPVIPSPEASAELFSQPCLTPRVQEGGVVIEATTDGVLCSQEAEQQTTQDSPSKSPDLKKARISENLEASAVSTDSTATTAATTTAAGLQGPTTLLIRCDKRGVRYSVLVAVVHPCHLKEVKVRSGPAAGTSVPLASIVVMDQSGVEMKVVLWRRAAFWALTVSPGDILLITGLQVNEDRWRGETVLQSTFSSKLLNLGQITASASPPAPQHVNARTLSSLCGFLRERRPLLVSSNLRPPQDLNRLPYATLTSLRVNTLVHALLRVTHTHISTAWRSEAESRCRSAVQLQAVLTVEQPDGQQGALLLWGAAVKWLPRFNRDKATVWDFHILLVRESLNSDLPELHSTPWSSVRPLDPATRRVQDFLQPRTVRVGRSSLELDLDTLLSQKYSGDVELRVKITAFHFKDSPPSQNAPQPVLDSATPLDDILAALNGDITYTGCGRCSAELDTDTNGIYSPCYPCLPHTAVRRYYRPGVLRVSGRANRQVCVQVPPVPLQKILEAPPDKLHKSSAPGSEVKHIQVAAERIQTLLSLPRKTFIITVQSNFLCDENSVPISQDFTLLDLQFPS